MESVKMKEMTWLEIKQAMKNGKKTAILVVGSMEQHRSESSHVLRWQNVRTGI